ncbi:translation initiation factor IF-2 [Blastopirellula marina]|uniref:Translation initiation factor IF-2 n=1 Tax=Blastopirellula marina TaxID=124 RepID=A0A2S8GEB5_9BACT|nr:translation initiation factor IF-2 [Blastopirellula marina]PQO42796.1 translation initiation factor IF-2 [Blastopirellula marina]PTL46562.1 translation initiation factor IF-2 [Blastopirellula marina]
MPIRIYALAKELQVDSKQLVDICNRAGVTGKGSALASLDDDELVKVKAFLNKDSGGDDSRRGSQGRATVDEPVRPERPVQPSKPKQIRTLGGPLAGRGRSKDDLSHEADESELAASSVATEEEVAPSTDTPEAESTPEVEAEATPTTPAEDTVDTSASVFEEEETPVAEAEVEAPEVEEKPQETAETETPHRDAPVRGIRRGDYIAIGSQRKVRTLGAGGAKKPDDDRKGRDKPKPKKAGPVVKIAKMPTAPAPKQTTEKKEPAAQKPIMQLPKEAIKGAKKGQKAPLEEFTKLHEKKRKSKDRKSVADIEEVTEPREGDEATPRGKKSKGKSTGMAGMAGSRDARTQGRKRIRNVGSVDGGDDVEVRGRRQRPRREKSSNKVSTAAPRKTDVALELPCTLREFSEATGLPVQSVQRTLMGLGQMVTINATLDAETAELLCAEHGIDLKIKEPESIEDTLLNQIDDMVDSDEDLVERPPVVTFLGHVDHGKTSLLDKIIGLNVVSGEAGGITQHIRAYIVDKGDKKISFVDTPGHEAFTEMRARGANVTDIAVLIVAADDGVMPQTEEAISHAKAANVPIIVALNKMDVPGANPDKALQQLSQHGLLPAEWGGDVEVVKTSAMTGEGVDTLLETILLTSEIHEYKANPNRQAVGVCLEAEQESDRGVLAKLIVNNGTLKVGDVVVCGSTFGRIKAMYDTLNPRVRLEEAPPSTPINVTGFDEAPAAGERFYVLNDIADAREIAEMRSHRSREQQLGGHTVKISFEDFQARLQSGNLAGDEAGIVYLNIILRADTRGSIEAIQKELDKLDHPEVKVRVMQATVGGVTVADVTLASASDAVIVAFNVIPDEAARSLADDRGVEIRRYDIIYKVTEDIKMLLEGRLRPESRVTELGRALVQRTFTVSRIGTIAGCRVLGGIIERNCRIRVNRDGRGIGDYPLDSLKREKDDVKEVREGYECGIKLGGFNDIKEGDILEAFKIEEFARTLES